MALFMAENENRRNARRLKKAHANILFNYLFIYTALLGITKAFSPLFVCIFAVYVWNVVSNAISITFFFIVFFATRAANCHSRSGTKQYVPEHKALFHELL